MGMLVKLIKAVIGAALLNKAVRNAFIVALIKSMSWILRPATISRIMAFFTSIAELALLRSAKRSGFSVPAALSALAAILLAMMKGREGRESPDASRKRQKDQIIDLDEYTILDDRH
jgi:hypothetical protein